MQLAKENLLQVQFIEGVLSENFRKIQAQLRKIRKDVYSLKNNEESIIDKLNHLDPFDQLEMLQLQKSQKNFFRDEKEESPEKNKKKTEDNQISRIQPVRPNTGTENENSVTIIDMNKNLDEACNRERHKGMRKHPVNESRETDRSVIQNNRVINQRLIKEMLKRLDEQEHINGEQEDRIQKLEMDNGLFRKNLGIKQIRKPRTNLTRIEEQPKEKLIIPSTKSLDQKVIKEESEEEDQNFLLKTSSQIKQMREYLAGKVKSIDSQIMTINEKFQNENKQLKKRLIETNESIKQIRQNDVPQVNENFLKTQQNKFSQKTKSSHDTNSKVLNETMQSQKVYYEDKIIEIFEEMESLKKEYLGIMEKISEENVKSEKDNHKDNEKLKNIALRIGVTSDSKSSQELKKDLSVLRRDHNSFRQEFSNLINGINTGTNQTRTLVIKPNETKQDWKNLSQKIFKVKQEVMSAVKEIQNRIISNNDFIVTMNEFQVNLGELRIMLTKKMDITQSQKTTKRIQNRLNNFIRQVCEKEGVSQEQDALIVRQPWYCLSCDTEIKNYTGKAGKTIHNDKLAGRKVNPESHMIRRNENNRLPSLH